MQDGHDLESIPEFTTRRWTLNEPDLVEISTVMREYLTESACFNNLIVDVIQSPSMSIYGNYLVPGFCGNGEVIEFGNHKHLYDPLKNKTVSWNYSDLIHQVRRSNFYAIGGGGMFSEIPNKEFVMSCDYSMHRGIFSQTNYTYTNEMEVLTVYEHQSIPCPFNGHIPFDPLLCDLYGSFYVCDGLRGNVLRVCAKGSNSDAQILDMMQNVLYERYSDAYVGLSGLLFIPSGTEVVFHVLPRTFPQTLLRNTQDINAWFDKYHYSFTLPLVVHNIMFNFDKITWIEEETDEERFCTVNNNRSQIILTNDCIGTRYIKSVTPSSMEFEGYFNVVSKLHRLHAEVLTESITN